jgi:hypothetical protein
MEALARQMGMDLGSSWAGPHRHRELGQHAFLASPPLPGRGKSLRAQNIPFGTGTNWALRV